MKKICLLILALCLYGNFYAQKFQERVTTTDSSALIVYTHFEFGYDIVLADLKTDFGNFLSAGTGINVKTKSNWMFGFTFNYQFEGKVKPNVLLEQFKYTRIVPANGNDPYFISSNGGSTYDVKFDYRGLYFKFLFGKVIPVWKKYENSGILLQGGIGVLQHYIHIINPDNSVLSLTEDYRKGYDKLTLGFSLYQFIGYQHLNKRNLLCFYGGIEFSETFSKRQRQYDFILMDKDNKNYFDAFIGFKIGWIIPLYKHNPYRVFQSTF